MDQPNALLTFILEWGPADPMDRERFERQLRLLLTGDPIDAHRVSHEPMRGIEAALIADLARVPMHQAHVLAIFRKRMPHVREDIWVWRAYLDARRRILDMAFGEPSPTQALATATDKVKAAVNEWKAAPTHAQTKTAWRKLELELERMVRAAQVEALNRSDR